MTQFNELKTKEIILPDSGAKVVIKDKLTFGTTLEMMDFDKERDAQLFMVEGMIISWDFMDNDKKPIPITADNIKKLSPTYGQFIINQIMEFIIIDKKKIEETIV